MAVPNFAVNHCDNCCSLRCQLTALLIMLSMAAAASSADSNSTKANPRCF